MGAHAHGRRTVCRVKVTGLTKGDEQTSIYFGPDYNDGRNAEWAKYTPSLSFNMNVLNEVAEGFVLNGTYDLILMPNDGPAVTGVEGSDG